jgi:hypothetical protein
MALSTAVPIEARSDVTTPIAAAELILEDSSVTNQEVGADQIVSVSAEPIEADIDLEVQSSVLVASTNTADGSRAEFLSATVLKTTGDAMLGIGLMEHQDGTIYISRLLPEGPLGQSPFRVGDKLLSINTKGSDYLDRVTAAALLRALEGTITIVAQNVGGDPKLVETMVEKAKPDSIVGIGLTWSIRGSLEVTNVVASGLFAHSLVNSGDRVISINKIGCNRISPSSAVVIIRNSPRFVTFLTETHSDTGVVLAASSDHADALELEIMGAAGTVSDQKDNLSFIRPLFCLRYSSLLWLVWQYSQSKELSDPENCCGTDAWTRVLSFVIMSAFALLVLLLLLPGILA